MTPWSHVIVHHSATPDTEGLETEGFRKYHVEARGWRDIGYHAVVERAGEEYVVIAGRPLSWVGSHAPGWNEKALGICFAGNFEVSDLAKAQLVVGARTIAGWMDAFGMGSVEDHLMRHAAVTPTSCPGRHFPMERLRTLVFGLRGVR